MTKVHNYYVCFCLLYFTLNRAQSWKEERHITLYTYTLEYVRMNVLQRSSSPMPCSKMSFGTSLDLNDCVQGSEMGDSL